MYTMFDDIDSAIYAIHNRLCTLTTHNKVTKSYLNTWILDVLLIKNMGFDISITHQCTNTALVHRFKSSRLHRQLHVTGSCLFLDCDLSYSVTDHKIQTCCVEHFQSAKYFFCLPGSWRLSDLTAK